jgi:hypothetical protein
VRAVFLCNGVCTVVCAIDMIEKQVIIALTSKHCVPFPLGCVLESVYRTNNKGFVARVVSVLEKAQAALQCNALHSRRCGCIETKHVVGDGSQCAAERCCGQRQVKRTRLLLVWVQRLWVMRDSLLRSVVAGSQQLYSVRGARCSVVAERRCDKQSRAISRQSGHG